MYARIIPILLIDGERLVKTTRFSNDRYIGDPRNAVRIFSQRDVDEIMILDIGASRRSEPPDIGLLTEIVSEAFVPVSFGGNIRDVSTAETLYRIGIEKVVIGKAAIRTPQLCDEIARIGGAQAVVACIDVIGEGLQARARWSLDSAESMERLISRLISSGAGEIVIHSVERDGTRRGYDIPLLRRLSREINVPLVAAGGAARIDDFRRAICEGGASAAAAGSLFVFYGRRDGVLISFPNDATLTNVLEGRRL